MITLLTVLWMVPLQGSDSFESLCKEYEARYRKETEFSASLRTEIAGKIEDASSLWEGRVHRAAPKKETPGPSPEKPAGPRLLWEDRDTFQEKAAYRRLLVESDQILMLEPSSRIAVRHDMKNSYAFAPAWLLCQGPAVTWRERYEVVLEARGSQNALPAKVEGKEGEEVPVPAVEVPGGRSRSGMAMENVEDEGAKYDVWRLTPKEKGDRTRLIEVRVFVDRATLRIGKMVLESTDRTEIHRFTDYESRENQSSAIVEPDLEGVKVTEGEPE